MQFHELLQLLSGEPVFETGLLLASGADPDYVRLQLSRWTAQSRLVQLRRELYAVAPPYRAREPHPFVVANLLQRASYVSLHAALAYYGLIPEYVALTTSVSTGRTRRWDTPLGSFAYRHIQPTLFWGYRQTEVYPGQHALLATPEKALLDLVYLTPEADSPAYLRELRLQNLDRLDLAALVAGAQRAGNAKLGRAAAQVGLLAKEEAEEYRTL
jgi:predicted transcriptional regulator of viral defense system